MRLSTIISIIILLALTIISLVNGSVDIPLSQLIAVISNPDTNPVAAKILFDCRIPQCLTAILAGAALSVAGLMLQTTLGNPLAGPSILGISTGASLGVAVITMTTGNMAASASISGALIGALAVLALIMSLSAAVRSNTMLLIVGIMISSMGASAIELLNFWSPAESVKTFAVWGMGTFANVPLSQMPVFMALCGGGILCGVLMTKPLNALLLGENYAASSGINVKKSRFLLLMTTGLLTAATTSYCGPVAFIGLAVPHIARMILKTSDHRKLFPSTILLGAIVALGCNIICVGFPSLGQLPLNAVTPVFGAPIVIYVATRGRRLK
ncbi:MAG: iron ABC transporter permease [Bacteroidales bacterium]|nr:iron ABC transporter permease [Bacteroidales bacterium]